MKRFRFVWIALSAALLLSACQGAGSSDPTAPATEPSVTEVPTVPVSEPDSTPIYENMYSVSLPVTTENFYTEDKDLIYSYMYQTIFANFQDRDVADKIIMDFADRIEKTRTVSKDILASAESNYRNDGSFTPYSYEIQYNVNRIDQGVLSLFGHVVQIGDTPRANSKLVSASYDMVTGDVLTVGSILYHIDTKSDLKNLVISNLEKRSDILLFEDFHETVSARFEIDESVDEDFYFTQNGLCFYFATNEIASRSYGTVIVEIPYNELTGVIADAYFPAERSYSGGSIDIHKFSDADLDSYQQFVDVIADENGTKLLFTTETAVQDIRIYELLWTEDGIACTQAKNIYASNFLSSDTAILMEADFNSFRPSFQISYAIDGETVTFYTVADAETGEITLKSTY